MNLRIINSTDSDQLTPSQMRKSMREKEIWFQGNNLRRVENMCVPWRSRLISSFDIRVDNTKFIDETCVVWDREDSKSRKRRWDLLNGAPDWAFLVGGGGAVGHQLEVVVELVNLFQVFNDELDDLQRLRVGGWLHLFNDLWKEWNKNLCVNDHYYHFAYPLKSRGNHCDGPMT